MSDSNPPRTWDRLPDEPDLWWIRFNTYRLEGLGRSILRMYQQSAPNRAKYKAPAAAWTKASIRWRWKERARAWDDYANAGAMVAPENEYISRLRRHHDNTLKLSQVALNNSIRLLTIVSKKLETVQPEDISIHNIPNIIKAASAIADTAIAAEAHALGVETLLKKMDQDAESPSL